MGEQELINGCIRGDKATQKALYQAYCGKMFVLCQRYARDRLEAQDFLQEGFIKVFANITQFKQAGSLEGWIRKIMVNNALRHFKSLMFQMEHAIPQDFDTSFEETDAISKMSETEILELINELPDGYRLVFNLYVIEGYSHKEIGIKLGITDSTSRSQLVKARCVLQNKIKRREKITI